MERNKGEKEEERKNDFGGWGNSLNTKDTPPWAIREDVTEATDFCQLPYGWLPLGDYHMWLFPSCHFILLEQRPSLWLTLTLKAWFSFLKKPKGQHCPHGHPPLESTSGFLPIYPQGTLCTSVCGGPKTDFCWLSPVTASVLKFLPNRPHIES